VPHRCDKTVGQVVGGGGLVEAAGDVVEIEAALRFGDFYRR
jgi:hypothetical protein